jgi:release factor glutamine methyltransferase
MPNLEIYGPAEDSYLISNALKSIVPELLRNNPEMKFLEIGVGSGINLMAAKDAGVKVKNITGIDINPSAVEHCKGLGFRCILSDLFSKVNGKFDVIAFNPPYLPLDEREPKSSRLATTGGKKGSELIVRFLENARYFLKNKGAIFIITSSLSQDVNFEKLGYKSKIIGSKSLFFEKLTLWEVTPWK